MIYLPVAPVENVQAANSSHELTSERSQEFKSIIDILYQNNLKTREVAINDQKQQATKSSAKKQNSKKSTQKKKKRSNETSGVHEKTNEHSKTSAANEGAGSVVPVLGVENTPSEDILGRNGTVFGSEWSTVTPEAAAQIMASKTGVPAETWAGVIYRESSNNPTIVNSIGCFGYLQLHPVHGAVSTWTPEQYFNKAAELYATQGAAAWEAW